MPSILNATTTTGLVTSADNSGSLQIATNNGTTAVTIGTDQVVTLAQPLPAASGGTGLTAFPAPSTSGNVLTSNGTAWTSVAPAASGIVQGTAVASTSGTSIDFTGIPSDAKRIVVMLNGVSTDGTTALLIQLGDSGGFENTGYVGYWSAGVGTTFLYSTAGFPFYSAVGAALPTLGQATISLLTGNNWIISGTSYNDTDSAGFMSGAKTLSGTLDRIRVTTPSGSFNFDAGTINIQYEV